jgi:hypothetical protein
MVVRSDDSRVCKAFLEAANFRPMSIFASARSSTALCCRVADGLNLRFRNSREGRAIVKESRTARDVTRA